jgi:hypothetical protein
MTERTWQGIGVAALAVGIVFGAVPILPDALRVVALVVALGLAVAAWGVRRQVRSSADREGLDAHGAGTGLHDLQARNLGAEQPPDQRYIGFGTGGGGS